MKRIQSFAGLPSTSDIEYDVSYSNRPAQGCERATQSFAPLIEQTTTKHLPISIETANRLCTKPNCEHNTNNCKRNYNPQDSIQSSKSKLLKRNLDTVHQQNILKIWSVTSDASTQIAKALRENNASGNHSVKHYKCFIHRMRSLHKHIKGIKLKSVPKEYDKGVFFSKTCILPLGECKIRADKALKKFSEWWPVCSAGQIVYGKYYKLFSGKTLWLQKKVYGVWGTFAIIQYQVSSIWETYSVKFGWYW